MSVFSRGLVVSSIAFLSGVAFAGYFRVSPSVLSLFVLLAFVATIFFALKKRLLYALTAVACLFFVFGALRFAYSGVTGAPEAFSAYVGTPVVVEGVIVDEPDVREGSTHLIVRPTAVNNRPSDVKQRILLFAPAYPQFQYGDRVRIQGVLRAPKEFVGEGGAIVNYPMYLATKYVGAVVFYPTITKLGAHEGHVVVHALLRVKHAFQERLSLALPDPHHALLSGLLLGGKQSLGEEWLDVFKIAGIVHIVVLSGYNMTIVGEWLVAIFRFTGFFGSLFAGGFGIVLFMVMTGGGATVVRAGIMALLALLARATGKTYTMGRALLFAGVSMVALHPGILLYDPSFQLSFLASLGLVFLSPLIDPHVAFLERFPTLREVVVSTFATQVMVLPLLLYQTGLLSLVALPVNMLVLPIIPLTMLFGFIAGVCAFFIPALATISALPAYALLSYVFRVATLAVEVPFSSVSVHFPASLLVTAYVIIALVCVRRALRLPRATPS